MRKDARRPLFRLNAELAGVCDGLHTKSMLASRDGRAGAITASSGSHNDPNDTNVRGSFIMPHSELGAGDSDSPHSFSDAAFGLASRIRDSEATLSGLIGKSPELDAACIALRANLGQLHTLVEGLGIETQRYSRSYAQLMALLA